MGKNTFLFATLLISFFIYSPAAQDATDSANYYSAGTTTALNDANGFQTENIIVQPSPAVGSLTIEGAVAAGGSALMNDSSGNAMVLRIDDPGSSTGQFFNIEVPRTLDTLTSATGAQVKFRAHFLSGAPFSANFFDNGSNISALITCSDSGWVVRGDGVSHGAATPNNVAIDFLVTLDFDNQTYDARLRRLDTNADELFSDIPFFNTSSNLASLSFQTSFFGIGLPRSSTMVINDIAVDSAGGLPVEIISFVLD